MQQLDLGTDLPQGPACFAYASSLRGQEGCGYLRQELVVQQAGYRESTVTDSHSGSLLTEVCTQLSCNKCQDLLRLDSFNLRGKYYKAWFLKCKVDFTMLLSGQQNIAALEHILGNLFGLEAKSRKF